MKKVYIILINYNNSKDTKECMKSLFLLDYVTFSIILVDNNSDDAHLSEILNFFIENKVDFLNLNEDDIINKSFFEKKVILIKAKKNKGFAAANNIALRYLLKLSDFQYVWILNNDTIVKKDSLTKLIEKAEFYKKNNRKVGIIGSKLLYYGNENLINNVGGVYNKWFGIANSLGILEKDCGQYDKEDVVDKIDYVSGASMFVLKEFIEDVGLMCEDYFLYYEELDWILRGKEKGWRLGYCWDSVVYHKEGATIGSHVDGKKRSEISEYYSFRNRILFTKKFYPKYIITVYLGFLITIFNRIKRNQWRRVKLVWKALREL